MAINNFPQDIILKILSINPLTPDLYQLAQLGHNWQQISALPSLVFAQTTTKHDSTREFTTFITNVLLRRGSSRLKRFHLHFHPRGAGFQYLMDSWLRFVVDLDVRDLLLDLSLQKFVSSSPQTSSKVSDTVDSSPSKSSSSSSSSYSPSSSTSSEFDKEVYEFPVQFLKGSKVKRLNCREMEIQIPPPLMCRNFSEVPNQKLDSILSLTFTNVLINDLQLYSIVSGCVNLKELSLSYIIGYKSIRLSSSSLTKLSLDSLYSKYEEGNLLKIVAPLLEILTLITVEFTCYDFTLESLSKLHIEVAEFECFGKILDNIARADHLSFISPIFPKDNKSAFKCSFPCLKSATLMKFKGTLEEEKLIEDLEKQGASQNLQVRSLA